MRENQILRDGKSLDITDAERVKGLLKVNAQQAERIDQLQSTAAALQRRVNQLRAELGAATESETEAVD